MSNSQKSNKLSLQDIDKGLPLVREKSTSDLKDETEKLQLQLLQSQLDDHKSDREMRESYARQILTFLKIYCICVLILIICNGFHILSFSLEKEILTTLVGSTAASAIGLVGFIAKGLFK